MTTAHDLKAEPLARATLDLLRAHPLPLLAPLVLLGIVTGGGGGGPDLDVRVGKDPFVLLPLYAFFGLVALAILILLVIVYVFLWTLTTRVALRAARGEDASDLGAAFRETTPRLMGAIGTGLLVFVLVVVGLVLLIAPGIVAAAGLLPWAAVLVAEGKDGLAGLGRAWELTKGHKVDLALLVLGGLAVSIIGGAILGIFPIVGDALSGALSGAVTAAFAALGAVYYDRRTRETPTPPVAAAPAVL